MIITIDISQIPYNTGVSRYTKELVRNLLIIDRDNHYKLFAGTFRQKRQIELFAEELRDDSLEFELIIKNFPPRLAKIIWNKLHIFPIEKFVGKTDIFHTSDWSQPPTINAKKVSTIHDLTPLTFPAYHNPVVVANFKNILKHLEKEVDFISCVSQATQKDLLNSTKLPKQKTTVIYNGVGDNFKKADQKQIYQVKNKFNITKKYILSVATLEPRKNINRLIKAFQELNNNEYQLVLSGKYGWGDNSRVEDKNIIYTDFVDDADLPALYSGATVFAYPSLYEGFGFPVAEAMACQTPVVTSNLSSLPEVVGDAAFLVDPKKTDNIVKALEKVLGDSKLQKQMSEKGVLQASKFTWENCAKQTLKIYKKLGN